MAVGRQVDLVLTDVHGELVALGVYQAHVDHALHHIDGRCLGTGGKKFEAGKLNQ